MAKQPPEWQPGTLVDRYRVESRIGAGGMAVVFRAKDEALDRTVALKALVTVSADDPEFRERFIRESRTVAAVDHPHIIPVYSAGEFRGVLYLAMRHVSGGDLQVLLAREGLLTGERAVSLIAPVAGALDAAHAAGVVHRDVKPGNILIDTSQGRPEHPYLSDFGLAVGLSLTAGSLTEAGQFIGTPEYSAPEQAMGQDVDARTDQYALACVAYEMLTGQPPFPRSTPVSVLYAHVSTEPPSVIAGRPDLPVAVDRVLGRALAKAPADRFPTCGQFASALRDALCGKPYGFPAVGAPTLPPGQSRLQTLPVPGLLSQATREDGSPSQPVPEVSRTVRIRRNEGTRPELETIAGVVVDPDVIGNRDEFLAALDSVRRQAELSPRDVATVIGLPLGTVRGYFQRNHLPAERDVLRQILLTCGISGEALPRWEDALVRVRPRRQRGTATGKTRARAASADTPPGAEAAGEPLDAASGENDLLFRIYIPKTQLYAEQRREMLRLFKEWLTGVQGQGVKHMEETTSNGDTVTFFAMPGQPRPPLAEEYREFASFVEHCAHRPADAVARLAKTDIGAAASADLVKKYSKEYHRLELDLRQARETRILTLQHTLEAELLERDASPQEIENLSRIRPALERVVPPPTSAALSAITAPAVSHDSPRSATFSDERIMRAAIESVQGTAHFSPDAKELMALIDRYAGDEAGPLRTALHQLEDPGVTRQRKSGAGEALRSFRAGLARRVPDVSTDLVEKYLETRLGTG